jgi:hypothetical protein
MPIEVACLHCRRRLRAPDNLAGKQVRCPNCQSIIRIPTQPAQENLANLLEDLVVAPPAPSIFQAEPTVARHPFARSPNQAFRRSESGQVLDLIKDHFWTIITIAASLPLMAFMHTIGAVFAAFCNAALVMISEQSRRKATADDELTFVDRVLLGILVGINVLVVAVWSTIAIITVLRQRPGDTSALAYVIGFAVGSLVSCIVGVLIIYLFARVYGLGRTIAVAWLGWVALVGIAVAAGPPEAAKNPGQWALKEIDKALGIDRPGNAQPQPPPANQPPAAPAAPQVAMDNPPPAGPANPNPEPRHHGPA